MSLLHFWGPGFEELSAAVLEGGEPSVPCVNLAGALVGFATGRDADRPFVGLWREPAGGDPRDPSDGPNQDRYAAQVFKIGNARPPMGTVRVFVQDGTAPEVARAAVARFSAVPLDVVEEVASER